VGIHLLREKLHDLQKLERWVRRGLEIEPQSRDLKATLAAVMVEGRQFAEAKPVFVRANKWEEDDRKRAWATFYLGIIYASEGDGKRAAKMFQETVVLSPSQWLVGRASRKLSELGDAAAG
jgi:uncharacterized protein HemY